MIFILSLIELTLTANLVKRESGKRSLSIPNYPNLPSSLAMDDSSSASPPSSSSSSYPASSSLLSSSSLSIDEPLAINEWLNYLRMTQKLMEEARSWEILQSRINQFGSIEMGQRQKFIGLKQKFLY
uniref:Uncharacterized protein n=1 Tax=Tetranychus urticae TaxID=32264 RepID=T1L3I6_TETUR